MSDLTSPSASDLPIEIPCAEVRHLLDSNQPFLFIDCRTSDEQAICRLPRSHLIPLQDLPEYLGWLRENVKPRLVVYCHHGQRSLRAAHWLRTQGFSSAQSMAGGIDAWSRAIDPSVPRYS